MAATSTAPREKVFALLADSANWSSWAGPLAPGSRWEREADPPGGVGSVRRLGRPPVVTLEEVVEFEPPSRYAYRLVSGLPVRDYVATVDLRPTPGGGTSIVWRGSFRPAVPGTGALLRAGMKAVVGRFATRLAAAADRG